VVVADSYGHDRHKERLWRVNGRRFVRYEGGQIGMTTDRRAATAWYCAHLGFSVAWDSDAEGQTLLRFPGPNAVPLVSVGGGSATTIWGETGTERRETNVRLCFACSDLAATRAVLHSDGVRVSDILTAPSGDQYVDLYDLEGTRLTIVQDAERDNDARISGYAPPRIGVRDLDAAIDWYTRHLGMTLRVESRRDGAALMEMGDWLPVWLEAASGESASGFARIFFLTMDIEEARHHCAEQGMAPSPVYGREGSLRVFHFSDLDGNRLSAWHYPEAQG
jgi:catechol 2,3-dioxygenase-like lactoylglutathione lyase family enzyme